MEGIVCRYCTALHSTGLFFSPRQTEQNGQSDRTDRDTFTESWLAIQVSTCTWTGVESREVINRRRHAALQPLSSPGVGLTGRSFETALLQSHPTTTKVPTYYLRDLRDLATLITAQRKNRPRQMRDNYLPAPACCRRPCATCTRRALPALEQKKKKKRRSEEAKKKPKQKRKT